MRDPMEPITEAAWATGTSSQAKWGGGRQGKAFLIGCYSLAWPALLKARSDKFANRLVPLHEILGDDAATLVNSVKAAPDFASRKAAADAFFLARRDHDANKVQAALIRSIGTALADPDCGSVEEMARRVGISQSRLTRLAKSSFGFAPKLLIRRARFRRMLHRMDARTYADWRDYIDDQYVDQSHLIRDFRFFMGMSPRQYMALERPFVAAAFEEFRRMMASGTANMWQS